LRSFFSLTPEDSNTLCGPTPKLQNYYKTYLWRKADRVGKIYGKNSWDARGYH